MIPFLSVFSFSVPTTLPALLTLVIALLLVWIVVSIPVYAAGEIITAGHTGFGQAMSATLGGGLVYFIVLWGVPFFLSALLGSTALALGFLLALVAWLAVYRASFETSWIGTIGLVLVAWLVFFILDIFLRVTFGVSFPRFYPF